MKGAEKQFWKIMVVLSLFDGISCGRVALEKAGKQIETYFASEIDKYSEKVAKMNYPVLLATYAVKGLGYPLFAYTFMVWITSRPDSTPAQPSTGKLVKFPAPTAISTAAVESRSQRLSNADARIVSEPVFRPTCR